MSSRKIQVVTIPGNHIEKFPGIFAGYVNTAREESNGILSDFNGCIDTDGRFYITRKGKDTRDRLNYEARLTGTIRQEGTATVIEYSTEMSKVFLACMVALGLLCAGFLTYALLAFFRDDRTGPLLPASFFTIAFLVVLILSLVRPECRALERVLDTVVGEYANVAEE